MKQITNKEYEEWQKYKAEKAKTTSCCRIPSGSSARPTALTQKRSVSTSLIFCRRSVRLKRDNENASEPMWFRGVAASMGLCFNLGAVLEGHPDVVLFLLKYTFCTRPLSPFYGAKRIYHLLTLCCGVSGFYRPRSLLLLQQLQLFHLRCRVMRERRIGNYA